MSTDNDLCFLLATEHKRLLDARELSAVELLAAQLAQVERVSPTGDVIVTLTADAARDAAKASDARRAKGKPAGPLDGLTVGVRDLFLTRGVHTPFGSPTTPTPYRTSIT